jgi:hypothetical protein
MEGTAKKAETAKLGNKKDRRDLSIQSQTLLVSSKISVVVLWLFPISGGTIECELHQRRIYLS